MHIILVLLGVLKFTWTKLFQQVLRLYNSLCVMFLFWAKVAPALMDYICVFSFRLMSNWLMAKFSLRGTGGTKRPFIETVMFRATKGKLANISANLSVVTRQDRSYKFGSVQLFRLSMGMLCRPNGSVASSPWLFWLFYLLGLYRWKSFSLLLSCGRLLRERQSNSLTCDFLFYRRSTAVAANGERRGN